MANSLIYIFLFSLINLLEFSIAKKCLFINNLPKGSAPLKIHCASGESEAEYFPAMINKDVKWSFCGNIFERSLFFCHFWLGNEKVKLLMFLVIKILVSKMDKSHTQGNVYGLWNQMIFIWDIIIRMRIISISIFILLGLGEYDVFC